MIAPGNSDAFSNNKEILENPVVIAQIYALVGSVVKDVNGNIRYLLQADIPENSQEGLNRIEIRVQEKEPLPTHGDGYKKLSSEINEQDLNVLQDATCIYTEGNIVLVKEVMYLAKHSSSEDS